MTSDEYAQYIDDFELDVDVMPGESLTDYIERRRREFESKADGGSIGIEVFFGPKRKDFSIGGNVQRATTPQPYDSRATVADFARAIQNVGAGTDLQKAIDINRYGQNVQRQNMLSKIKDAGTNLAMQAYGLNPTKAGIAQDPSMLEFQEIKTAGLPQKDYSAASTYGMLEDMTEGNPITRALAGTAGLIALPANEVLRPAYDLMQGVYKGITDPNKSIPQAIKDEKIPEMLAGSREGVLQFIGDQFGLTNNRQNIVDSITKNEDVSTRPITSADYPEGYTGPMLSATGSPNSKFEDEMRRITGDSEGYAAYAGIIPGFKARKRSDGRFEYKALDGQIYGPDTYADIAAGRYPNIYDPNKQSLADGGRVGLFMGGDPLTGQALQIYNSMNAYGFSDQEIADALSARGLYTATGSGTSQPEQVTGIINQQIQTGDGGGVTELQKTFTEGAQPKSIPAISELSSQNLSTYLSDPALQAKYGSAVDYDKFVQSQMPEPNFIQKGITATKDFFSKLTQPKVRGTLGTRLANQPRIPLPAAIASYSMSPFNIKSKNYNPLLEEQLNFAETQEGIIGRNPNTGLLQYGPESVLAGKNVVSFAGTNDYELALKDYISKMNAYQNKKATEARSVKIQKAKRELEELQRKTEAARAAQYGQTDYGRGSDGQRSYDFGQGFGIGATTGGPVSNRTGRGRQDYSKGGLATMFTRRR